MAVSERDLRRFLAAKLKNNCPACGTAEYLLNGGPDTPGMNNAPVETHIPGIDRRPGMGSIDHTFYTITCNNCGFTNFHHINQISRWLKENPDPGGDQSGA